MFEWEKMGRIFNPQDYSNSDWMSEFAQAPSVLIFDEYIRVYFSTRPVADFNGQYKSYSAFVDLDKKDLFKILKVSEKPILQLGEPGTFDEFGTYPTSVIQKNDEIHAYYGGWTRCESVPFNVAIGHAVSQDNGISFIKSGSGPILSYSLDEPFVLSGPKIRFFNDKWYLFYIAGSRWVVDNGRSEPVYKIRMAISKDGINWEKVGKNLIESVIEEDEAQASPDVFFYDNKYHMYFSYRYSMGYRGKEKGYRIGYASSENLIDWKRDDSKVGIDVSEEGWDSEMISYPHVFKLDNEWYMFYLGNQVGRFGFGAARLKKYKR